jgi:hypothetical protein
MRMHNVQEVAVAHFTAHPHIGSDDIGIIVLLALMLTMVLVGFINDNVWR